MNIDAIRQLILNDPRPTHAFSSDVRRAVGRYAERRREDGVKGRATRSTLGAAKRIQV